MSPALLLEGRGLPAAALIALFSLNCSLPPTPRICIENATDRTIELRATGERESVTLLPPGGAASLWKIESTEIRVDGKPVARLEGERDYRKPGTWRVVPSATGFDLEEIPRQDAAPPPE